MAGKYLKVDGKWTREEATEEDLKRSTQKFEPIKEEPPKPKTHMSDFFMVDDAAEIPSEMPTLERSQKRSAERQKAKGGAFSHENVAAKKKTSAAKNNKSTQTNKSSNKTSSARSNVKQTEPQKSNVKANDVNTSWTFVDNANDATKRFEPVKQTTAKEEEIFAAVQKAAAENVAQTKPQKQSTQKIDLTQRPNSNSHKRSSGTSTQTQKQTAAQTDRRDNHGSVQVITWEQEEALRIKAAERDGTITGLIIIFVMAMTYGIYTLLSNAFPAISMETISENIMFVFLNWIMGFATNGMCGP